MTVRIPPKNPGERSKAYTIDFRGMAPSATTPTMFDNGKIALSASGGLAMLIPGELAGLQMAHDEWGAMTWKEVVVPNAELAMGWTVDKELARRIQVCNLWTSGAHINFVSCSGSQTCLPTTRISEKYLHQMEPS